VRFACSCACHGLTGKQPPCRMCACNQAAPTPEATAAEPKEAQCQCRCHAVLTPGSKDVCGSCPCGDARTDAERNAEQEARAQVRELMARIQEKEARVAARADSEQSPRERELAPGEARFVCHSCGQPNDTEAAHLSHRCNPVAAAALKAYRAVTGYHCRAAASAPSVAPGPTPDPVSAPGGEPWADQATRLLRTPSTAPTGERGEAERCKRSPAPTGGHVFNPHDPEPRRCIWCGFVQSAAPVAAPGAERAQRIERLLRAKLSFVHGDGATSPPVAAADGREGGAALGPKAESAASPVGGLDLDALMREGKEAAKEFERRTKGMSAWGAEPPGPAATPVAAPMGALDEAVRACERLRDSWRYGSDGRLAANEIIEALRASQRNSIAEPRGDAATMAAAAFVDDGCKGSGATPLGSGDARPQTCASASPVTVALPRAITPGVESALATVGRGYPQEAHVLRAALNASYSRGAARERAAAVEHLRWVSAGHGRVTVARSEDNDPVGARVSHVLQVQVGFLADHIEAGRHTPEGESEG